MSKHPDYDDEQLAKLPEPCGYRILIAIPAQEVKFTSDGGILQYSSEEKAEQEAKREEAARIYGFVLKIGSDAYKDSKKFPSGAWCREGDFVIIRSYAGTRFKLGEQEFRLINDDTVEAVVPDPTIIKRAI